MAAGKVGITELVLRDGHQSMIATRMNTDDMLPILDRMDDAGFFSLEMWGGATFDVCLRYLKEDPWERLRKIRARVKKTKLQMLLRGQNVVGYKHYPDDIVEKFVTLATKNGIDIFRIFDALNDIRNMKVAIAAAKKSGAVVEGSISYTISPVHTVERYVAFAKELASLECDIICIKDMAGLLSPVAAQELVSSLVKDVGLPVHVHSHTTGGLAQMTLFAAVEAGAKYIDTCMSPFSQGSSHSATESVVAALRGTAFDTGIDLKALNDIAAHFYKIREKYKSILDPIAERIDTGVLIHQIPGGMLSNLVSQLKEQNALDKYEEVLAEVPRVRAELGYPPLVTPTSQIVGTQAVFNVILGQRYKLVSKEVKEYIRGMYGKSPAPIDENVRRIAIGDEPLSDKRPADSLQPLFDKARGECCEFAPCDEDILSYALFPQVALEYFKQRIAGPKTPGTGATGSIGNISTPMQKRKIAILGGVGNQIGLQVGTKRYDVTAEKSGEILTINLGTTSYEIDLNEMPALTGVSDGGGVKVAPVLQGKAPSTHVTSAVQPKSATSGTASSTAKRLASEKGAITAPMPGKVIDIKVSAGQKVEKSSVLVVLEAMKMQNEIIAPYAATVKEVRVQKGESVSGGAALVLLE